MRDGREMERFWELVEGVEFAMLVTEDGGHLRGRPMALVRAEGDSDLWFFTRGSSHKVMEVEAHRQVNLSFAHPGKMRFVSVSGQASLVRDRAAIDGHWRESMRTWFPDGKDDPDIALLRVTVEQAEYWDTASSAMVHLFGYLKAVATGESPRPGENAKIS